MNTHAVRTWIRAIFLCLVCGCQTLPIEQVKSRSAPRISFLILDTQQQTTLVSNKEYSLLTAHSHYAITDNRDGVAPIVQYVNEAQTITSTKPTHWHSDTDIISKAIVISLQTRQNCFADNEQVRLDNDNYITIEQRMSACAAETLPSNQLELLIALSQDILKRNPGIKAEQVIAKNELNAQQHHTHLARLPWYDLYLNGVGAWYDDATAAKYWQQFNRVAPHVGLVQTALQTYGYQLAATGVFDQQTLRTLRAFQAHFTPWQVDDTLDANSIAPLFALLEKYYPEHIEGLLNRYQDEGCKKPTGALVKKRGQVDQRFPFQQRSERKLVNDRALFKAYQGQGRIIIENIDAQSADVFVNGEKLNIETDLVAGNTYKYSLKRRTKGGDNTLRVDNVSPEGASINIVIPYPVLHTDQASSQYDFSAVDSLIDAEIEQGFPGAVLLVLKDGQIIKHSAYGYARKYQDSGELMPAPQLMSEDTVFDIASNTKMFATNFAIMKLVSEGRLNIDLPIATYLPNYKGDERATRLVRDLLSHQAGYAPHIPFYHEKSEYFSQSKAKTKQLILNKVPFVNGRQVKQVYSDTDFMLLGMLVEELTQLELDQYVEQQIYQPLALTQTKFNPLLKGWSIQDFAATEIHGTSRQGRVQFDNVRSYVLQGEVHDEKAFHSFNGVAGHAGLFSTTGDLSVLMQSLLNRGGYNNEQLFSESVLDQFIKPNDHNGSFGLGWRRYNNGSMNWLFGPYASPQAYGHSGWTGTVTVIDPKHDLAIALLTNARHTEIEGSDKVYEFVGKSFELGKYGSIMALIYEAILEVK